MQGTSLGIVNVATGISLLPETGNHHVLFLVAASLLVSGVIVLAVSTILNFLSRRRDSN